MPAPDLISIYNLSLALEENFRTTLLLPAVGFTKVFTRLNAIADLQKDVPHLALEVKIGAQNRHASLCPDGIERNDQWAFQLRIGMVTQPVNKPEENSLHMIYQAQVRATASSLHRLTWTDRADPAVWPYHAIAEPLVETGTEEVLRDKDSGVQLSTINFNGVVAIRSDAWPTS